MENKSKRCWIDIETSGLSSKKHSILTMGVLMETGGNVIEESSLRMRPFEGAEIDDRALKVNGLTKDEISDWPTQKSQYYELVDMLRRHVDKFNRMDKLIFCAYNATFDDGFLREFFIRNGDSYYGSYFFWPKLDVQTLLAITISNGLRLSKYNLATVCEHYDIELDAHDALSDIKATRELYYKMRGEICS